MPIAWKASQKRRSAGCASNRLLALGEVPPPASAWHCGQDPNVGLGRAGDATRGEIVGPKVRFFKTEAPAYGGFTVRPIRLSGGKKQRCGLYQQERFMNLIIWLVVGGLIGWVASLIMKRDAQQGILLNIVVGIVGSILGGWLVGPLLGAGTINQNDFSLRGLLASLIGAVILLAIVNLVRRGAVR